MKRFLRDNGLSIVVAALFLVTLAGHSVAGWMEHNEEQRAHGDAEVSYGGYVTSTDYGEAVFENWESEFLQMGVYVLFTIFLFQRGSAESKDPDEEPKDRGAELEAHRHDPGAPGPVRRGGLALVLYKYSLVLAFFGLFLASFVGHAVTGAGDYNAEQTMHGAPMISTAGYLATPRFWSESLENWQSEFLSVLAMVVLSIWLRADSSPESKPTWKPHRETGAD